MWFCSSGSNIPVRERERKRGERERKKERDRGRKRAREDKKKPNTSNEMKRVLQSQNEIPLYCGICLYKTTKCEFHKKKTDENSSEDAKENFVQNKIEKMYVQTL